MNPNLIWQARQSVAGFISEFPELSLDETLRADMIEAETDFNKIVRVLVIEAMVAKEFSEAVSKSIREFQERRSRLERREERARSAILSLMQAGDLSKLKLPEASLSVMLRGPQPVTPDGVDGLPDEFVRVKREPNMPAIRAAIKEGREVPGIAMTNGGVSLMIR